MIIIYYTNQYYFSVIISVYNSGRYLNESIGSLINQTIGFENIQIILVNDGSTDNSENICLKYKELYNNIIYVKIPHYGVSKARNIGMTYAKGLYINFLDSDDKWESNAFKYVALFFKLYKNIDIISCRIKYFESWNHYHFLDYKFKQTRLVNLTQEYNCIQLSASSSFFRSSSIKGKYFTEGVFSGEDIRFIFNILLIKPLLIFIKEAIYYYRKRSDSTSAIQNTEINKNFYIWTIQYVQQYLIDKSISLYKKIVPFIQFYIAYETLFRIESKAYKFLDSNNYIKYCNAIESLLNQIEEKFFLEQLIFPIILKLFALSIKNKSDINKQLILRNESIIYSNHILLNLNKYKYLIIWRIVDISNNILHLEGEDKSFLSREKYFYFCKISNQKYYPKYNYYSVYDFMTMFGKINEGRVISFDIPLKKNNNNQVNFFISYNNKIIEIFPSFGKFSHMSSLSHSYYTKENFILKKINNKLVIYPYQRNLENSFENLYCIELKKINKEKIIDLRTQHFEYKRNNLNKNYKIWMITDRPDQAQDNGEYFFRYLNKLKPKGIIFYFAIKNDSFDYHRLRNLNNIIDLNSEDYLKFLLKSDKLITSCSELFIKNPIGEDGKYISDFYNFDYIYLNNGIIKDDLTKYLNKITQKFSTIITSSKKEYNSILNNLYGYKENNLLLTGLPRYDNLFRLKKLIQTEKFILIFPTWRMNIKGTRDLVNHNSIKSEHFKNSIYFQFYNNLINNKELLQIMNKYEYKGIFCLHPNFIAQKRYFIDNKIIQIKEICNNQKILLKTSLLITDYSSVFFDFGFIEKPILYIHFDYDEYRRNHFPEGYFNYKKDGFGPVCYDSKCLIKNVEYQLKNKCKLKKIYSKRIKQFFRYIDDKNSMRVFKGIIKYKNYIFKKTYYFSSKIFLILFLIIYIKIYFIF